MSSFNQKKSHLTERIQYPRYLDKLSRTVPKEEYRHHFKRILRKIKKGEFVSVLLKGKRHLIYLDNNEIIVKDIS